MPVVYAMRIDSGVPEVPTWNPPVPLLVTIAVPATLSRTSRSPTISEVLLVMIALSELLNNAA